MCFRLYGTILLLMLGGIVLMGVRVVNKFALPTIAIVFCCIGLTFIGAFVKFNGSDRLKFVYPLPTSLSQHTFRFCMVGDRIPNLKAWTDFGHNYLNCTAADLEQLFCTYDNSSNTYTHCDSYFDENRANVRYERAIAGMASGAIACAFSFTRKREVCEKQLQHPSGESTCARVMCWTRISRRRRFTRATTLSRSRRRLYGTLMWIPGCVNSLQNPPSQAY